MITEVLFASMKRITEVPCNFMTNMVTRILIDALQALSLMIMMSISFLDTPHQGHGDPPFNQISE